MKDTTITFRLTEQEKEKIIAAAAKKDIPFSQLIREAIREFIREEVKDDGIDEKPASIQSK